MTKDIDPSAPISDAEIKRLFFSRDERAVDEVDKKYGALLLKTATDILCPEDAEECVNDAYMRLWNSIPPQDPKNLVAYALKAVRNVSLSRLEYNRAEKRGGGVLICELDECANYSDRQATESELSEAIDRFLRGLSREKRVIFVLRYFNGEPLGEIAGRIGCGEGRIKSVLWRLRKELKKYLEREGISL